MEVDTEVDAAVLGGGPAGIAAAIALSRAGLRAVVIEESDYGAFRIGETVPPDLRSVLRELGAWESFARDGHLPSSGNGSAWGSAGLEVRDAFLDPRGHGWHLDRARFDATLAAEAQRAGAEVKTRTRLIQGDRQGDAWSLFLKGPSGTSRLAADWIVDASGRGAAFARRHGARRLHRDRLVACFAVFAWPDRGAPADLHTLIEAAEDGWWYTARLPGDRAVVSWMSDGDLVRRDGLHRRDPWIERLGRTRHVRELLRGAALRSDVAVRAAASHCLDRAAGDGWIAVGDAACAFDPLSSAGIVTGLRSGLEAARAVAGSALAEYDARVQRRFAAYLDGRREQYALEARWPESAFWQRRQHRR
jgi:flavin-dependent dehydrogenase